MSTLEDINRALLQLNDALCSYERNAGSGHTLLLIPHFSTLPVHVSVDGKPVTLKPMEPCTFTEEGSLPALHLFVSNALRERKEDHDDRFAVANVNKDLSPPIAFSDVQDERRRRRD